MEQFNNAFAGLESMKKNLKKATPKDKANMYKNAYFLMNEGVSDSYESRCYNKEVNGDLLGLSSLEWAMNTLVDENGNCAMISIGLHDAEKLGLMDALKYNRKFHRVISSLVFLHAGTFWGIMKSKGGIRRKVKKFLQKDTGMYHYEVVWNWSDDTVDVEHELSLCDWESTNGKAEDNDQFDKMTYGVGEDGTCASVEHKY